MSVFPFVFCRHLQYLEAKLSRDYFIFSHKMWLKCQWQCQSVSWSVSPPLWSRLKHYEMLYSWSQFPLVQYFWMDKWSAVSTKLHLFKEKLIFIQQRYMHISFTVNPVLSSHRPYLLCHARSQQHVNTLLDGCSDFSLTLRQMRQQRLPVDLLTREAQRRPCTIR